MLKFNICMYRILFTVKNKISSSHKLKKCVSPLCFKPPLEFHWPRPCWNFDGISGFCHPILLHYLASYFSDFCACVIYLISIWCRQTCKIFVCFMVRFRALTHRVLHAIIVSAILAVLKLAGKIADAVTAGENQPMPQHKQAGQSQVFTFNFASWLPLTAHRSRWCTHCSEWSHRSRAECTASAASSSAWAWSAGRVSAPAATYCA